MKKILGVGNALVDALVSVGSSRIISDLGLALGGMTLIDDIRYKNIVERLKFFKIERATGGSAANALLAAASLGADAAFIGKTGDDDNGTFFLNEFCRQGVEARSLHHGSLPTGVATTFVTPDGQRTFATYLGASATLSAHDLRAEWFEGYAYFFIEGYLVQNHDLIDAAVDLAHQAGAKVCLDLASWNIVLEDFAFFEHLLRKTDLVFANEEEAQAMTKLPPRDALKALSAVCETAVVKLGKDGACACERGEYAEVPALQVPKVIDTTGAGDFFAGAFLSQHAKGASLQACLTQGARCAAEVIQVMGTKLSAETWTALRNE